MKNSKSFVNAKWIIACRIAQSLLQLIVGMLCARYLGPSNYGLINYAKSVVSFVLPLMQLGLDAILVQELLAAPEREGKTLGTALAMNFLSGIFCMVLVCGFVLAANPAEPITLAVCCLYSLSLLFRALEGIQYWFHSRLQSKYPSVMMLVSYVVVSAYKIFLLVSGKSVLWFAVVSSIEYGVISLGLFLIYRCQCTQKLTVSLSVAKSLFAKGKYYILSSFMVMAFQNTDHIMLTTMVGHVENGYYSAAITCTCVVQFVYTAIIDSARPVILSAKKSDPAAYERNISRLYCVISYLTLAQTLVFAFFAKWIVQFLYGTDYLLAVLVLQILVLQLPFSFMGAVRNIWILAEEKHSRLWIINLCGVAANVVLNLLFIPHWGACGAAAASVLTQIIANFIVGFVWKEIRPNNRLLLSGLRPSFLIRTVRQMLKKY